MNTWLIRKLYVRNIFFNKNFVKKNKNYLVNNESGKKLICGTIIHACDLYTSTKTPSVAQQWVLRINEEFSNQVKDEEKMGNFFLFSNVKLFFFFFSKVYL